MRRVYAWASEVVGGISRQLLIWRRGGRWLRREPAQAPVNRDRDISRFLGCINTVDCYVREG